MIKINTNTIEIKDYSEFKSNYEAIVLKNLAYQIDLFIKNEPTKEGVAELSNNLINSLIENKAKLNKLKKLRINDWSKLSSSIDLIEKRIDKRRESLFTKKKGSFSKTNLLYANQDEPYKIKDTNLIQSEKLEPKQFANELRKSSSQSLLRDSDKRISHRDSSKSLRKKESNKSLLQKESDKQIDKKNNDSDLLKNKTIYEDGFKGINIDVSKNIKPEVKPLAKTAKSLFRHTFSHINIDSKRSKDSSFIHKAKYSLNRNSLYAQKFLYKSFYNIKDKEKEKNDFPKIDTKYLDDKNKFNKISNKLNFVSRKKIDDLIKTQYYFSNYKNCFKMKPNYSDFSSNKSNLYNFKNMWNDIKSYTKDYMEKEKNRKKFNFNIPFRKLHKSKSASDIKSC